jgi:hypothetical protein
MKLLSLKAKSKNHLIFVVGTAMSFGLIYLFVAPKLVKPAAVSAPAPSVAPHPMGGGLAGGNYSGALAQAYRGHGGHRDEGFLAHAYAVRDTSISDVYPYRFRLSGGV